MLNYYDAWEQHTSEDAWVTSWWSVAQIGDRLAGFLAARRARSRFNRMRRLLFGVASCFDFFENSATILSRPRSIFRQWNTCWEAQARMGANVEVVHSDDAITVRPVDIVDAIDATTCLVALSHVSFRSSYRVEVKPIVAARRSTAPWCCSMFTSRPARWS